MFIVGIAIAKRSHMVRVIDAEGRTVYKPFSIRNSCSGCSALLERLRKLTNCKSDFLFAMESTAHYWLALYIRLHFFAPPVLIVTSSVSFASPQAARLAQGEFVLGIILSTLLTIVQLYMRCLYVTEFSK